jgi:hypothetical protein
MSIMALRRNPYRKCKREEVQTPTTQLFGAEWSGRLVEEKAAILGTVQQIDGVQ